MGTENASHVRTNRAAFSEASMSRVPANCIGWLATTPTGAPSTRPKPTMMLGANASCTSRKVPSSSTVSITACMSYGWFAESGMRVSSASSCAVTPALVAVAASGGSSRLLEGR